MKLLLDREDMKVYVNLGSTWADPVLAMEHKGEKKVITMDSGELECPFGEFLLNENQLSSEELKKSLKIVNEISNVHSIKTLEHIGAKRFTLNEKYMAKLNELDKITPTTI